MCIYVCVCMYVYMYIHTVHARVLLSFQQPTLQQFQTGLDIQMLCVLETCILVSRVSSEIFRHVGTH